MTENEKQDLYKELQNNYVTKNSERRVIGPYTYTNNNYNFGDYRILFRIRTPASLEIKHGEIFIFKYIKNHEPVFMGHWDGTDSELNYLYDMYMTAKNKLLKIPYQTPYTDYLPRITSDYNQRQRQ